MTTAPTSSEAKPKVNQAEIAALVIEASNPDTAPERLTALARLHPKAALAVAGNPATPASTLRTLARPTGTRLRGVIAGNGGTQRIMSQVPYAIGMEILLTGDSFNAATAERWGLVNKVVPMDQLLPTAMEYAKRIAANAPLAVQAAKELAIRSRDLDLQSGLRLERLIGRMLQNTEDVAEGTRAFAEKRPPQFKGR